MIKWCEGCFFRLAKMQMDVQGEGNSEERWNPVIGGNQNQCTEVVRGAQTPAGIIVFTRSSFYITLYSCFIHVLPFFHLIATSCHLKHRSWTVLISDSQVPAAFTMFPLTILSLGANIYKLLKWPSMSHLLSRKQMLMVAERWGRSTGFNLRRMFASFVWLWWKMHGFSLFLQPHQGICWRRGDYMLEWVPRVLLWTAIVCMQARVLQKALWCGSFQGLPLDPEPDPGCSLRQKGWSFNL